MPIYAAKTLYSLSEIERILPPCDGGALSVDFFDTLVFRNTLSPADVFENVAKSDAGKAAHLDESWAQRRRDLEHQLVKSSPHGETTLAEIYRLAVRDGLFTEEVAAEIHNEEIRQELSVWIPNTPLLDLLKAVSERGYNVVVASDTYLPSSLLRDWLGRDGIDFPVHCSCEVKKTKRKGDMFSYLRSTYPGKIVHIGDNRNSDCIVANRMGVDGWLLAGRGLFSSSMPGEAVALARLLGMTRYPDAIANHTPSQTPTVIAQWAYCWSLVLTVFLDELLRFSIEKKVDQIWFMSRDCEAMFDCLGGTGAIDLFPGARYVYFSRSSIRPLLEDQAEVGASHCADYVQSLLASSQQSPRIMIVDTGWNGTIQTVLSRMWRNKAKFFGFYVALDRNAAAAFGDNVRTLVPWNTGQFSRAMTEFMFGFRGGSCLSYSRDEDGRVRPVLSNCPGDTTDPCYYEALKGAISAVIKNNFPVSGDERSARAARLRAAKGLITRLHIYPRKWEVLDLTAWRIGTDLGGTNDTSLVGQDVPLSTVLLTRFAHGNIWPFGAVAYRLSNKYTIYLIQRLSSLARSVLSDVRIFLEAPTARREKRLSIGRRT